MYIVVSYALTMSNNFVMAFKKVLVVQGGLMANTLDSRLRTLGLSTGHSHGVVFFLGKTLTCINGLGQPVKMLGVTC